MNIATNKRARWWLAGACALVVVIAAVLVLTSPGAAPSDAGSSSTTTVATAPARSSLVAPKASASDDAQFLSEVSEVDPALMNYEKKSGNVALRSLLTDGAAFCAFLARDRNLDTAMVSVVLGARHVEPQTRLPLSVTTFNAVDTVALLTLCPSLQSLVPAKDLAKIRTLGAELAGSAG